MPAKTNAREKLDGAIAEERQQQRDAKQIYDALTAKMWAYQTGNGPRPPTKISSNGASPWSSASRSSSSVSAWTASPGAEPARTASRTGRTPVCGIGAPPRCDEFPTM
jgi:hypothetical protein